jgi:hypothetical protein
MEDKLLKEALAAEELINLEFISKLPSDEKEEEKKPVSRALTFLQNKSETKKNRIIVKPAIYETEQITRYIEEPDIDTGCIRYYYPTLEEFIQKNLPCAKRPWVQEVNGKKVTGKEAYEDPMLYKPGQIFDYVQSWYIDYFEQKGIESPFAYSKENIFKTPLEICNAKEFTLQPHQKFVGSHMSNMTNFPSMLLYHRLGSGKSACFGSKVLLYNGQIEEVQNIKIGDILMGPDSKPRTVLDLGRGQDMMYEVIPLKGQTHTFTSAHVLSLKCSNMGVKYVDDKRSKNQIKKWCASWFDNKKISEKSQYFETEEEAKKYIANIPEESKYCTIEIKDYIKLSEKMQNQLKLYRVGVNFPHKEIPLDPYILGLWIGDGNSLDVGFTNQDAVIIVYLKQKLPEYNCWLEKCSGSYHYRFQTTDGIGKNYVKETLKLLNLLGNKHIPDIYKINSRQVQLQVLAGILDTDGHLGKNGCYEFCQVSEKIMDDVIFIARSLGFAAYKSIKKTSCTVQGEKVYGTAFRTTISGNIEEIPCKIKRKQAQPRQQIKDHLVTGFKVIEKGIDDYYGFTLDQDHLYLVNDFMVTHNSCSAITIAESNKGTYINDGTFVKRKGSLIPQKKIGVTGGPVLNEACNITIVLPRQTINQFLDEIRGSLENGEIRSCTSACIYTESDVQDSDDYIFMRQLYTGKIDKDSRKPVSNNLQKLQEIDNEITTLDNEISGLNKLDKDSEDSSIKKELQGRLNILNTERNSLVAQRDKLVQDINRNVQKVYFLITHDSFLNRITTKIQNNHVASNYMLGLETKKGENLPHPDCFHSDKAVLIIDEVQKITREGGINYFRLYDTLMINARDKISGLPRMKVILLTATPIFDNPHEASLMLNFQRPRIPFPLSRILFEEFFINKSDKDNCKIINKLCYQYLFSGYVSFSQGANPKGFPLRRNNIMLHDMSSQQLSGYINALSYDIKKDANDKFDEKNQTNFFDIAYRNQIDDNQQSRYLWSRQLCNIFLPTERKNGGYGNEGYTSGQIKSKEEVSAEHELNKLIDILKGKQREDILPSYKNFSPKFHYILQKIIESSEKDEGPIVVYCEWIWYGILAMTKILQLLGWKFLDSHDIENIKGEKKFGIWSSSALTHMGIRDESVYTSNLSKVLNHRNNSNGNLCKVLFTTVTEGISLKRVSQLHITSPWWNESREEQIIGRGIRFCSHADLPITRQYVDIYYHCSVLDSFKNYPEINRSVDEKIINAIYSKSINKPSKSNFKDLARLTIEQKVYITARRKNDINNQFEIALKETAVDFQLNKYGNLLRFEEIINPSLKIRNSKLAGRWEKLKKNERILYSRSENKYYYYNISSKHLYNMDMYKKESNDQGMPVWPNLQGMIGDQIKPSINWTQHEILLQTNQYDETMVSFIVTENLNSFNNNPVIRDKNFKELMNYAINQAGEESKVWNYFEDQRVRTKMFSILVSLYKLSEGTGSALLLDNFNDRLLSGSGTSSETKPKIIRGVATEDLTIELTNKIDKLSKKTNDDKTKKELQNLKKKIGLVIPKLPHREPLDQQKAKKIEKRLKSLFFHINDSDTEKMKDKLVSVFGISRAYLDNQSEAEIAAAYDEYTINQRNRA